MGDPGGGESSPTPPLSSEEAFRRLLTQKGKKRPAPDIPKFIKKLEDVPEIALQEDQPIKIALALADRGLVGQFMGRWPSTKTTDEWIQRNWRPQLKNSVICYPVGRGFFIFEFTTKEDRDLVFRNGPYFMGNQGLYLNKWTPDFDPSVDVPKEVPVWVRLPNLPIHCWSYQSLQKIGNGLGRFIDKADPKGQYTCARICVEVDLEVGLPEAIKITVGEWQHYQMLDYEQLPFKCRTCHEHGHFHRNCPKSQVGTKEDEEGWKEIKRGKAIPRPTEKKNSGSGEQSKSNLKNNEDPKVGTSSGGNAESIETQEATENPMKEAKGMGTETITPPASGGTEGNKDNEDHISLASESDEDSEGRTDESDSSQVTPIKSSRGRKSKKKLREEKTYRDVLQGSQKTLKGMMNTRGLGSKLKEDALKDIVRMHSPEILLIQETKMEENFLLNTSKSFWRKGIGCAVSARGASGGIATFWDSNIYDLLQKENSTHWIFTKLLHKDSGHQVSLFNIYAPVLPSEKNLCWDSISSYLSLNNPDNIIIAGDMNVTLAANEKRGGSQVRDPAREWVEDLILGWDLEDIKPSSGKFTWSNKRVGPNHIAARLDRFLVQTSFLTCGLTASSKIFPNSTSDHKPIILELSTEENLGPIPFRFSSLWLQHEGFQEMVSEVWKRPVQGSPFYVWEEKLRRLKRRLKDWARTLKSPSSNIKEAMDNLAIHQMSMENTEVTQDLLQREIDLQKEFHKASRVEEEFWRQKSRALWLQAGDKNTSFFHKHAEARKQFKSVKEIHHQGVVVKDFEEIKRAAHSYFKDLYSAPDEPPLDPQIYPMNLIPNCVQDPTNAMLMAPISMKDLRSALDSMEPDKAPGPDGFPVRFYLSCWDIINSDLLRMVKKSQSCAKIGGGINSAFLALIPKEKGAANFSRFRPISLCNSSYKLITKIIAQRLKKILPAIIPENQGGFIKGRKILDNIVLVQEAVHSSYHRKEKGMVIKLDLANAFDRVKHEFLFMVMDKMGFSPAIINWIKACIASPWIAPLVNGRPSNFFQASRGLRQGCPLSPLLYAIQASVLSFQLDHNLQSQILPGLRMVHQVKDINHAQFADDTLLLGGASINSAKSFKKELDSYREVSGSKINYAKSTVYSWNCSARELFDIARILQMEGSWDWESFKYLGIPIFRTIAKVAHWTPLLDKIKS
eukprot:PITA_01787